ncbi:MAG TPA: hypothetical protein PKC25_12540 [Candidatus Rifleibacterium sp.]|nr:hypothetical protein [Candidatus Rifleibacterium sp.]
MIFIETSFFTKRLVETLPDEEYRQFQTALALDPELGDLIPGSCGIRKVRWNLPDTGKKGGIRVIYYWAVSRDQIYLLLLYKKTVKENIDPDQLEILRQLVKGEFK